MLIKLISPKLSLRPMDTELKRIMAPSLSLLTLAAITPDGYSVEIADENIAPLALDDSPDLVGITVTVDSAYRAYDIAGHYKRRGIPTVLGGIHASACPDEALLHCDSVCIGHAEPLWLEILNDVGQRALKPRYQADDNLDASTIPLPAWDAIDPSRYLYSNVLSASRGCPFRCDFCYNSCEYHKERYVTRPIKDVIREITHLQTQHVMFVDDNLIGDLQWAKALFTAIKPLNLKWNAAVSANLVKHEALLDQMTESGCQSLFIGFESITEDGLSSVNKSHNRTATYEDLIDMIHSRGIMINASLVFGLDDHTPAVFQLTSDWLIHHKIETMTAHIMTPFPGTELYSSLMADGRIIDFDWSHYNTSNVVFTPRNMSPEQLLEGYLWMYRSVYSFKNIWKRLPDTPRQRLPYLLFNLGYRKFGRLTSAVSQVTTMSAIGRMGRKWAYGLE